MIANLTKGPGSQAEPHYDHDGFHEDGPYELRLTFEDGHTSSTFASGPLAYRSLSRGYQSWLDNANDPQNTHGECTNAEMICAGVHVKMW